MPRLNHYLVIKILIDNIMKTGKIAAIIVAVIAVGAIIMAVNNNAGFSDGGINVAGTACEELAAARAAVDQELAERQTKAGENLATANEAASDAFWDQNRSLEQTHADCISEALIADPCKESFERASRLAQEILAEVDAGNGFDEAKFQEREQAKKDYDKCLEDPDNQVDGYNTLRAQCDATLATGQQANQDTRQAAETAAQAAYDAAVAEAENAQQQKYGILNAIEEKCNEPAEEVNIGVGGLGAGGTDGTVISTGRACSGVFTGNDSDLEKRLRDLEHQLQKARAAGMREGLYGSDHLQEAVDNVRQELKESERTCESDADCGDTTPVCCSSTSVGRVFCDAGVCANEITECEDPEVCSGEPAQCVNPSTGSGQNDGVYISRIIPEVGSCSNNLQVLNLQQASLESQRYEITGNIPSWVNIDNPNGNLPATVNVGYSCGTVQGFGPGTYEASGNIQVYDANSNLINTIPFDISVTVEPVVDEIASNISIGTVGGGGGIEFVYDHTNPVCPLAAGALALDGPEGATWTITSAMPVWLQSAIGNSGLIPATVNLQFPCQLDSYKNQSLSTNVEVTIVTAGGETKSATIPVNAEITGF